MIITIGFILLVSLVLNSLIVAFSDKLVEHFSMMTTVIVNLLNLVIPLLMTGVLFGLIYRILPDAKVSWRSVMAGGMFTSVLFAIGKYAIGLYLGTSSVGTTFGAAGSIVVLLLWTYYTSQILFIGAEFTYVYAKRRGEPILPNSHAVKIIRKEVDAETGKAV
jgi:membrane protein